VHTQQRDNSGLYPLTLNFSENCNTPSFLSISKKGGGVSEKARTFFSVHKEWARGVGEREKKPEEKLLGVSHFHTLTTKQRKEHEHNPRGALAKFYIREGTSIYTRWHNKLGHIGGNAIRRCDIPGLVFPKAPYRCEACILGKMHHMGHSRASGDRWAVYKPGEYLLTDLQGPYVRSVGGGLVTAKFSLTWGQGEFGHTV